MDWSIFAKMSGYDGQPAIPKTELEQVIEQLAAVAAELTEGAGDQHALKEKRAHLVTRFYQIRELKPPSAPRV
jgi:hypothetical protein